MTADVIQKVDGAFRESSLAEVDNTCESVSLLKAADSPDLCDIPMDTAKHEPSVLIKADNNKAAKECNTNNTLERSEDNGQPKKDEDGNHGSDETDTDAEVIFNI